MTLHSDWVAAKKQAAKLNGGKELKFKSDKGLGPAMDGYEKAKKRYLDADRDAPEWIKIAKTYLDAAQAAGEISAAYSIELETAQKNKKITKEAAETLSKQLMGFGTKIASVKRDEAPKIRDMMKKRLDKQKKK
jgi:hypothetical protein